MDDAEAELVRLRQVVADVSAILDGRSDTVSDANPLVVRVRELAKQKGELEAQLRAVAEKCERLDERRHELHDLLTASEAERDRVRATLDTIEGHWAHVLLLSDEAGHAAAMDRLFHELR